MIPASLKSKLREWQPALVEATVNGLSTGSFLNASGLGTGKSFCATGSVQLLGVDAVFMCRKAIVDTVHEIATQHFGLRSGQIYPINLEMVRTGRTEFGKWVDGERDENTGRCKKKFIWNLNKRILIWDEVHSASALNSLNSEMLRAAKDQGVKLMMLSGTAADHIHRMRSIGYALDLHSYYDFWQFCARYGASPESWMCGMTDKMLKTRAGREELERRQNAEMAKIHERLIKAGRMIRLRSSEIPGFPQCSIHPMCIDFDSRELTAIFAEMQAELEELKKKGTGRTQLEVMMRARQKAELLMVPTWAEMAEDAIEEGESVVFFLNFTATVRSLAERLKTDCIYTGENLKDRAQHHARFMADESRVIVTNQAAAGESIGFQDKHGRFPRTGIVSPSFWAAQVNQVLGRLPRDGAKTPSKYYITFPRKTVAEQAYKACKRRTELYGAFNGDVTFTDADLQEGLAI
jgi:superfamily II DNA or RNA helicase